MFGFDVQRLCHVVNIVCYSMCRREGAGSRGLGVLTWWSTNGCRPLSPHCTLWHSTIFAPLETMQGQRVEGHRFGACSSRKSSTASCLCRRSKSKGGLPI